MVKKVIQLNISWKDFGFAMVRNAEGYLYSVPLCNVYVSWTKNAKKKARYETKKEGTKLANHVIMHIMHID